MQLSPVDKVCMNCGETFVGYPTSKYCRKPECQEAHREHDRKRGRERQAERRGARGVRVREDTKKGTKLYKCLRCDKWQEDRVCKPCQKINSAISEEAIYTVSPVYFKARIHARGAR